MAAPALRHASRRSASAARRSARRFGLPPDVKLGVGIERLDYTKGILERLRAVERVASTSTPDWMRPLVFVQLAAPSRGNAARLPAAAAGVLERCADEINERYGSDGYQPIVLLIASTTSQDEVYELYRAADVCVRLAACTTA